MVKNGKNTPVQDAPPVTGLELLSAADFRHDARFASLRQDALHWRRLGFHLIVLVTDGASAQCVDFHEYHLQRGDVLLVAPQQLHHFVRLPPWQFERGRPARARHPAAGAVAGTAAGQKRDRLAAPTKSLSAAMHCASPPKRCAGANAARG